MSAWIVSKGHIDCLVQALAVAGIVPLSEADATGQMLWHENYLSIEARYGDEPNTPEYHFTGVEAPLDPWIVYKQARCYDYQTCEHEGWATSEAYNLIQALVTALLPSMGVENEEAAYNDPRWNGGAWGIDSIDEAVARSAA